ncbi:MAG: hypothetical protein R3C17_10945 [Planctomycetaceae bacterium]
MIITQAAAVAMKVVRHTPVGLLTTDVNLQDLNGREWAKTIVKRRNNVRVLFVQDPAFDTVPR